MQSAAAIVGREFQVLNAGTEREFDAAFAALEKRPGPGLIVSVDPLFDSHRSQLIALAQQHALPTVYYLREFAEGGGLVSYGASITDAYRQAGVYAGRILKGAKPADLPVQLPTRFEPTICTHLLIGAGTYEKRESYQQSLKDRREGASKTEGHLSLCI